MEMEMEMKTASGDEAPRADAQAQARAQAQGADLGRVAREMVKALAADADDAGVDLGALAAKFGVEKELVTSAMAQLVLAGLVAMRIGGDEGSGEVQVRAHLNTSFGQGNLFAKKRKGTARDVLKVLAARASLADAKLELEMLDKVVAAFQRVLVASVSHESLAYLYISAQDLAKIMEGSQVLVLTGPKSTVLVPGKSAETNDFQLRFLSPQDEAAETRLDALLLQGTALVPITADAQRREEEARAGLGLAAAGTSGGSEITTPGDDVEAGDADRGRKRRPPLCAIPAEGSGPRERKVRA